MMRFRYENLNIGTVTEDRDVAVKWTEDGIDVGVWMYAVYLEEWIVLTVWCS